MKKVTSAQNIRYYDAEADDYDENRYRSVKGRRVDLFQKKLLTHYLADLPIGAEILDLGCGTGRFLSYLSGSGHRLTGIDVSERMLDKARQRIKAETSASVTLIHSKSERLPFDDGFFDAVYSILVVNLIHDYPRLFDEVARVIKPGGSFVFNVPNLDSVYFPVGAYVNLRGKTRTANKSGYRYSHWFRHAELKAVLTASGFVIDEVKGQPPHVRLRDGVSPLSMPVILWLFSKSVYLKARLKQ